MIADWIRNYWNAFTGMDILEDENSLLLSKVKAQDDLLYQVDKAKLELAKDKIELQKKLDAQIIVSNVLNVRISERNSSIESLKTELAMHGVEIPTSNPSFLSKGLCYQPNVQVEGEDIRITNPPDIYSRSDLLYRELRVDSIKSLPKYEKLSKIWNYVIKAIEYKYDAVDNWQYHPITILRKFGDCLPEDTFLTTSDGNLFEIKDSKCGMEIIGLNGEPTKILNVWNKGTLSTKRFSLSNKSVLECTSNHKVFVVTPLGDIREILASELKVGDELLSINKLKLKKGAKQEEIPLDMLKLYGLHIADGWVEDSRFSISGKDGFEKEAQKMWVKEYCESHGLNYRWHERYITINNKEYADKMFVCGHTAINKQIPFSVSLSEFEINSLLDGLRADAHLKNIRTWIHRTISKKLSVQTRMLYKQLGIQTSLKLFVNHGGLGKNPIYDLTTRNSIYPITVEKIEDGRSVICYDIETENNGIYLPESDIIVHNCEDGTILFLDACRMCGIPADKVFNTIGNTSFGYHSYPIVWMDVEDLVGTASEGQGKGWYIYETTLDFLPTSPKKLKGSNYWCEGGLQNWKYFGVVRTLNYSTFNGVRMPAPAGDIRNKKIDNSERKRNAIIKYWRDSHGKKNKKTKSTTETATKKSSSRKRKGL